MSVTLNKRIIDKINESEINEQIKAFLKTILVVELEHFEEGKPRYAEEYDRNIQKYVKKYKVNQ